MSAVSEPETGKHERRHSWAESTKVIWGLFTLVGLLLGGGITATWGDIKEHEGRLRALEILTTQQQVTHGEIIRRLDRIEAKLEREK